MSTMSSTDARKQFPKIVSKVAFQKKRIRISRRGEELAAVIPMEDLELLVALEDRIDLEDARAALRDVKRKRSVSWKKIKKELGL